MSVVEVGQNFVTRNAIELLHTVACREYTLPRDDPASEPQGWIRGNTRIGPILEITTSFQHFKFGVEVRIQSVNEDNSHSWVRISYGTVRYVNNYIKYNTQNLADLQEEEECTNKLRNGCCQIESKSKASTERIYWHDDHPIKWKSMDWHWTIKARSRVYNLSKKVINLLRHNQKLHREEDGAIQFYKIKFHLRDHHSQIQKWSDLWLACLFQAEDPNEDISIALITWDQSFISVLFKDILGTVSLILRYQTTYWLDLEYFLTFTMWEAILIFTQLSAWTGTWRPEFEQKTICVLLACWSKRRRPQRSKEYWLLCSASCPIRAKHLETASGYGILDWSWSWNHQRRIEVLSNTIERNYSSRDTSSKLHSKSWKIEKLRKMIWKAIIVSSPITEDLFEARSQLE